MTRTVLRLAFGAVTLFLVLFFAKGSHQEAFTSQRSPYSYTFPGPRPPTPSEASTAEAVAAAAAAEAAAASRAASPAAAFRVQPGLGSANAISLSQPKSAGKDRLAKTNPFYGGTFESDESGIVRKVIVVRQTGTENTTWVRQEVPGWEPAIYSSDYVPGTRQLATDRGREANAYLTYILENYDTLPDLVAFMHAHRGGWPRGWHIDTWDNDNSVYLQRLRVQYVREAGFTNLRCQLSPGCPNFFQARRILPPEDDHWSYEQAMRHAWPVMFPGISVPDYIGAPCCAQFVVSREQILARPREDYLRYWTWLMESPHDDHMSGTIMEYLWHIIFGREPEYCPDPWDCACNNFGDDCYDIEDLML